MKILIVTQKVDSQDPILGFFHRWIEEFALHCESVVVIGHSVGEYSFPSNVSVASLHKEKGTSKFSQIMRFRSLIRQHKNEYDSVFVHMTPIWIVLGADFWMRSKKQMYLWYEARGTRWPLRVALRFVRKVFSASAHGMPLQSAKSVVVGHGIDTDIFRPGTSERDSHSLISVGRFTEAKRLDVIIDAFSTFPEEYQLYLYGATLTPADTKLQLALEQQVERLGATGRVHFDSVTQEQLIPVLQKAHCFLHASTTSLDKAVLEAMACGCVVVSCAEAVQPVLPAELQSTPETFSDVAFSAIQSSTKEQRDHIIQTIIADHSLKSLIPRLLNEMSPVA